MTYLRAQILYELLNIYSGLLCVFTYYVFKDQIQFELSNSYIRKVHFSLFFISFTSLPSHSEEKCLTIASNVNVSFE